MIPSNVDELEVTAREIRLAAGKLERTAKLIKSRDYQTTYDDPKLILMRLEFIRASVDNIMGFIW